MIQWTVVGDLLIRNDCTAMSGLFCELLCITWLGFDALCCMLFHVMNAWLSSVVGACNVLAASEMVRFVRKLCLQW